MPKKQEDAARNQRESLLTMKEVCKITSWSRTSVNRLVKAGKFPAPVKVGDQKIGFWETEIQNYLATRDRRPTHCPKDEGDQAPHV